MNKLFKLILIVKTIENFPTAILDKIGFIHGNILYKIRNKNMKFIARSGTEDMAEITVVTSGYEYGINSIKLLKNPTIVDLGGHIGTFSILMARKLKDKCRIFTFEPDEDNYSLLEQNINLNKIKSITPQKLAISDYVGKGFLKKEKMNTDAYHLDLSKKKSTNCEISTLPVVLKKQKLNKVDLLKMDIEGAEYNIFQHKQSLDYILENVHFIFMEYHDINKRLNYELIQEIIEKNFRIIKKRSNILTLENMQWK